MAEYAVVNNGTCENIVVCDSASSDASWILITDSNKDGAGVGATYDAGTDTFTPPANPYSAEELSEVCLRALIDSDWTQLPDVGLTTASVANWATYRAKLRQIKDGDLGFSDWPTEPEKEYL